MKSFRTVIDTSRRRFLTGAGMMTAGMAATSVMPREVKAAPAAALVDYPSKRLANVGDVSLDLPRRSSDGDEELGKPHDKRYRSNREASEHKSRGAVEQPEFPTSDAALHPNLGNEVGEVAVRIRHTFGGIISFSKARGICSVVEGGDIAKVQKVLAAISGFMEMMQPLRKEGIQRDDRGHDQQA